MLLVTALAACPAAGAAQRDATIPSGEVLALRMDTKLSSKTSRSGDRFTATVSEPLLLDGRVVVPQGSKVEGRVTGVEPAKRLSRSGTIAVEFDRIVLPDGRSVPVVAQLTSLDPEERRRISDEGEIRGGSTTKRNVIFIGGGAGVGAIIGAVSGSAGVGTGVGAGLGTAAVLLTKGNEAEIDAGYEFGLELLRPVTIPSEDAAAVTFDAEGDVLYLQAYMRDRGLYTGPVDGRLSTATRAGVVRLQRDLGLAESGDVDLETARAVLLASDAGERTEPVRVLAVDTTRGPQGVDVLLTAETNSGGWGVYESHFVARDALHVYVRGVPPAGPATQALERHELRFALAPGEARGATRFVVHGADGELTGLIGQSAGGGFGVDLADLGRRVGAARAAYERALGIRVSPRGGGLTLPGRGLDAGEVETYMALDGLERATALLARLSEGVRDPQALRGATQMVVRDARQLDRALERSRSPRGEGLAREWRELRPEYVRLAESIGAQFERDVE